MLNKLINGLSVNCDDFADRLPTRNRIPAADIVREKRRPNKAFGRLFLTLRDEKGKTSRRNYLRRFGFNT